MKKDTINALYRYFEALYELNQNLIVLCGIDVIDNRGQYEKRLEDVIQVIPRLVPYQYNKRSSQYELDSKSGLMKFSNDIQYLASEYSAILRKHENFLERTKRIRNKLEHEMHGASIVASESGTTMLFRITYNVNGDKVDLCAEEMIMFAKDLNSLFERIQNDIDSIGSVECNSYIMKLNRFTFTDFNKVYESDLLRIFGKAMLPF